MKKKKILFFVIMLCFIIIRFCLYKITFFEKVEHFFSTIQIDLEYIKNFISVIGAVMVAGIIELIGHALEALKIFLDRKNDREDKSSRITIYVNDVSSLRSGLRYDDLPEIVIGNAPYFVYVSATVKNIGANTIEKCSVNDNNLDIGIIEQEKCYDFNFRVCRYENEKFRSKYILDLKYRDDKHENYQEKLKLEINEEKQEAEILPYRKLRRYRR